MPLWNNDPDDLNDLDGQDGQDGNGDQDDQDDLDDHDLDDLDDLDDRMMESFADDWPYGIFEYGESSFADYHVTADQRRPAQTLDTGQVCRLVRGPNTPPHC